MTFSIKSEMDLRLQVKDKFFAKYHVSLEDKRNDTIEQQKMRARKGAFFTPKIWVDKSQEYLEKTFGENWQDEYYVWDCCCGTGNLLAGLTNPDNVWASTIDMPDIDIIHQMIDKGFNLLKPHVFTFDFLNDEFIPQSKGGKLPDKLYAVINDPEKQKKLIIYINPPYGECGRSEGKGFSNKSGIAKENKMYDFFESRIGKASRELSAFFTTRIYHEIPHANLAIFAKLKYVNAPNFKRFREFFRAEYKKGFIVLASTFDNVTGQFPISFLIWDLTPKKKFRQVKCNILQNDGNILGTKTFYVNDNRQLINEWIETVKCDGSFIGSLSCKLNDFQNNKMVYIAVSPTQLPVGCKYIHIHQTNLLESSIYFTVRHCIEHTWINDRDQFLYPNDSYKKDKRFQNNCLVFTLFHHQNRIQSKDKTNHWIPFSRKEVKGKDSFTSTFMYDFLQTRGKFSKEANVVIESGKMLWQYYHKTIKSDDNAKVNASLYDIREYFKGRTNGRMNTKSTDQKFNELDQALKISLKNLAGVIKPKVYEYGFLLQ